MLANRLRRNLARLAAWAHREGLDAWRVYDRDIPEVPWTIDRYGERVLCTEVRTAVGARQSPADRDSEREQVAEAVVDLLGVSPDRIAWRTRERHRSVEREARGSTGHEFPVAERGLRFLVNLEDYLDTGLFLDHREARRQLGAQSSAATVLNLFCYTGAFTAYAARGGARRTVSVDLSQTYLSWAGRNLQLNGIAGPRHEFVRDDAFAYLSSGSESFDRIILDPPTVSRSARGRSFDVQSSHVELIRLALRRLAESGTLLFSTNDRRFQLDLAALAAVEVREISAETQSRDFREQAHRSWELRRRPSR
jgi:23S rRNA G2069 N7-methylase RlmK/C1962 C5-methylase RlmI